LEFFPLTKKGHSEISRGKLKSFFHPGARFGSWRPWWSANRDKIYRVVR